MASRDIRVGSGSARRSPNIPNRDKSVHSRGSGNAPYVRIRHPEFHEMAADELGRTDPTTLVDQLGGTPEPEVLKLDQPCTPAADTACYLLDNFARTLAADTYSPSGDGGAWSSGTKYIGSQIQDGETLETGPFEFDTVSSFPTDSVLSTLGEYAYPHTSRPSWATCGLLQFVFAGWKAKDSWVKYVVPAHATDAAGIILGPLTYYSGVQLAGGTVGQDNGAQVVVMSSEPAGLGVGTVVGTLAHDSAASVFIPAALIPAEGADFYVGVIPNWQANYGDYACGWRWPWMTGAEESGVGYVKVYTDTIAWQSWDVAADDWGGALDSDDTGAWWDGSLPWEVTSSGGTRGMDGDTLYLEVAAGSQETLFAKMEGSSLYNPDDDDDTSYGDPWSHNLGIEMKARWKLTTAGDVTETGSRYLYFQWHDGRDYIRGTVHLGDTEDAQGITVSSDDASEYVAKDITEGSWMWVSIDTRMPDVVRMKMWVEQGAQGAGEPATWDLAIARSDDAEVPTSDDAFEIGMSVGNMTGAAQKVQVDAVWFCGPGDDCEWVEDIIGQADGETTVFYLSQPAKTGAAWVFVDGMYTPVKIIDATDGEFRTLDGVSPDEWAWLIARYEVDRNPDGD